MGLFDRFRKREEQEITPPVSDVLLKALISGETITREKALTLPAVAGAVDYISNTVASMPVKLYKFKQGSVNEVEDDPRVRMLNGDTQDTLDAFQMKKAMVEDYLLGKGGYCFIERYRNDVTGLFYVEDRYITVLKNFKPIYKDYVILVEGKQYEPFNFLKLLRNTKDGAEGVGLTQEVSKALETAYSTLIYQLGLVKAGGNKRGFLESQRKLGTDEIELLKKAWRNLYGNNEENVVVLNNGIQFKEASNTAVESQLNESKNTLTSEINNLFHIYPNDFNRTFKEAIYPVLKAFETALNRDLLLEKEKKNCFFEFDVKEILKATIQERYDAYKLAKETGFMTLNEIRRAENMNWIEGLDVVNVGLGAVLYDVNKHIYYTPNTDTIGDMNDNNNPDDGGDNPDNGGNDPTNNPQDNGSNSQDNLDKMLIDHELVQAYDESGNSAERLERYNDNHDAKNGQFAPKAGGGIGGGSSADLQQQLSEIKAQMSGMSMFDPKRKELSAKLKDINDQLYQQKQSQKTSAPKPQQTTQETSPSGNPVTPKKEEQFEVIQKNNPMTDDYHTGIRKPSDIKSATEAFKTSITDDDYAYPDFTKADGQKALETGKITVYSSKPIGQGGFVSPSKMMAQDYAGGGKVFSQTVSVDDVAWIDSNEGQYAKTGD